jgi:hypothetical protein
MNTAVVASQTNYMVGAAEIKTLLGIELQMQLIFSCVILAACVIRRVPC